MTDGVRRTALVLLFLAGCVHHTQTLVVRSQPVGAEVEMVRLGQMRYSGGVVGYGGGQVQGEQFEDAPLVLGTTPLSYEFPLSEDVSSVSVAGVSGRATRTTYEVLLRARRGNLHAERRVRCTGRTIDVDLLLVPDEQPPQQQPQSMRDAP